MSNWVATTRLRWRRPKYKVRDDVDRANDGYQTRYSAPVLEQLWADEYEEEWRPVSVVDQWVDEEK
jgi:hypothetical protein